MLYQLWQKTAQARRNEIALRDAATGLCWTFGELFDAGEARAAVPGKIACPQGNSPEFILSLLAAWREDQIVCPLESNQAAAPMVPAPEDCAHLKWTSGTTDSARTIAFTTAQLAADARHIVDAMGLRPDWPNLGVVSLAHSYGFSNLVLPLLLHGIPLILAAPLPEAVRRAAKGHDAITLAAVPAMWRAWHDADGIPKQARLAISAGAPLPLNLEESVFEKYGVKIHNFYGASECGGIAYDATGEPRTEASLAGSIMPGVEATLGDQGCLVVTGPAVGQTYWPKASVVLSGGQYKSSDLADISDGKIYLRGRASDLINAAGRKISPEAIERALLRHTAVRECVVFGVPSADASRADTIVALVAADADESMLKQFLLETLPSWQVPRVWKFVEALPTGPRGKISRADCRSRFAA